MVTDDELRAAACSYYEGRLRRFGATPAGVDWNSQQSQDRRFRELSRLWEDDVTASVLDYGCGYGALAGWLRARGHRGEYLGFDLSEAMIRAAEPHESCRFTADRAALEPADYAVASGVLNVKGTIPGDRWHEYVLATIDDLAQLGRRGFAFNALTAYADPDKQRGDLYYADPLELFDRCRRRHSRFVTLLHDYPLYEFTLIIRM